MQCLRKAAEVVPADCYRLILSTERHTDLQQCLACPHGVALAGTVAHKQDQKRARRQGACSENWMMPTPAMPPECHMAMAVPAAPPTRQEKPRPPERAVRQKAIRPPAQDNPHVRALRSVGKSLHSRWVTQGKVGLRYLRDRMNTASAKTQLLTVNGLRHLLYAQGLTVQDGGVRNRFKVLMLDDAWRRFMSEE